ncbi:hypothetical protein AB0O68_34885 [Streptomyces sp. NPDC087512]|uniref:hypothetical protein n=1 Tax=Streptomyces sp. NPDC087512 TaxID=3155059 RepID=UPI003446355E
MPSFQTEDIPHGFAFDESGKLIHPRYVRMILPPPTDGASYGWKKFSLSFGSDFDDAKVRVAVFKGTTWAVQTYDVPAGGGRVGFTLDAGTLKVSVGRMKTSAGDRNEDTPLSWLLESQA